MKERAPKFKVGDVLVDGRGWRRQIVRVITDFTRTSRPIQYHYNTEDLEAQRKYGDGRWNNDWFFNVCSEEHLIRKGYKKL